MPATLFAAIDIPMPVRAHQNTSLGLGSRRPARLLREHNPDNHWTRLNIAPKSDHFVAMRADSFPQGFFQGEARVIGGNRDFHRVEAAMHFSMLRIGARHVISAIQIRKIRSLYALEPIYSSLLCVKTPRKRK